MNEKKRSDVVAGIMGKMLLKGYRMSALTCDRCDTVIMQDKEGRDICVNCDQDDLSAACEPKPPSNNAINAVAQNVQVIAQNQDGISTEEREHLEKMKTKRRKIELEILNEMEATTSKLEMNRSNIRATFQSNTPILEHIRDCASTISALRNMLTK